ncbi:hypothetical protein AMTR_s00038p00174740 [Amborella trichopoda]|uniref:Uncharacterized protein n=1 Tax=Amborella trichopoda TaxID=13333 RepID=U5CXF0_AMBTC|nr:hypothetical protein AMTR_s00038p00174740 [Amborella trichopoda]
MAAEREEQHLGGLVADLSIMGLVHGDAMPHQNEDNLEVTPPSKVSNQSTGEEDDDKHVVIGGILSLSRGTNYVTGVSLSSHMYSDEVMIQSVFPLEHATSSAPADISPPSQLTLEAENLHNHMRVLIRCNTI